MRIFAAALLAVLVLGVAEASAWEEYIYLDQGVAIQFPAKPQAMKSTYDSIYGKGLPAMVYSAEDDHVIYKLTAIDVSSRPDQGSSFVNEAGYDLMRKGNVLFTDFPRVYHDDRKDGSRARTSLYYHKGRFYIAEAVVLPARGDKDMTIPSRYDMTIRFPPDRY
jgi:hypothetical protein